MKDKSKPICVLDACTIINLIYIDLQLGGDYLIKKLKEHLDLSIAEKVLKEVDNNKFLRISKSESNYSNDMAEIGRKVADFRQFKKFNEEIRKGCGKDFFDKVKKICKYPKDNGEFHSTCLSLYLSRDEFSQLTFYTDDGPARRDFSNFFEAQQIGQIADSVDLLVFLYWLDPDFNKIKFRRLLSDLYSQYKIEKKNLLDLIRNYRSNLKSSHHRKFIQLLRNLENKLEKSDFVGINAIKKEILKEKRRHNDFYDKFEKYSNIFELEAESKKNNLLTKIQKTLQNLEEKFIYKI